MSKTTVRTAIADDLPHILTIERRAAAAFADIGYPDIANGAEMPVALFEAGLQDGLLWVARDAADHPPDHPVAYALAAMIDGIFYLEDISVDPDHQRKGLGDALVAKIIDHARFLYCPALVLSTLEAAPWSSALYRKHGFLKADMDRLPTAIAKRFAVETELGLPAEGRIVMVKQL
ncbi:GNAT family N-acetyltransferase [Pararhizobium sp. IMCC21322]|uniref:GNAT family N-acetyltransferase n=1 Tax=Pararhizobium sp. IMCC21322 TaxID=3067903 RepID=UPI0027408DCF|nr:GNAT family N-acetyltransferase [Pararhizobium sp. IMCC21322]